MAFRIWFYFLILTGLMLLFMWMLQITFIGPYYEKNRAETTQLKAQEIKRLLMRDDREEVEREFVKILASENLCGGIYLPNGTPVLVSEANSTNCQIKSLSTSAINEYIQHVAKSPNQDFSLRFTSEVFEQGLYFYGKGVEFQGSQYYLFLNSPIELLDSTIFVLKRQFGFLVASVLSIATFVAFLLSKKLSMPLSKMTREAKRLARGDFSVQFDASDYSEVSALSDTLNFATQEFKKTDDLRRDLVANVSHDIKTPLTMIRAYAEMIKDISGDNKEQREEHLGVILDEVHHLERLVNDMLTLSKYESEIFAINETEFNLSDHIRSSVNLFQIEDIDFEIDCEPTFVVKADEIKMGQVLYNFINNATKFVGDDRKIIINVKKVKPKEVLVSVIDHGKGIAESQIESIWDRYYKIDKNFQRNQGTGLGLSIVKAICEANGSQYGVESQEGQQTTFFYTLRLK